MIGSRFFPLGRGEATLRISAATIFGQEGDQRVDARHFSAVTQVASFLNGAHQPRLRQRLEVK